MEKATSRLGTVLMQVENTTDRRSWKKEN